MALKTSFDKSYYLTGNYCDYLQRGQRYERLAAELPIEKDMRIIDYGCAVGFLLEGLQRQGFKHISGYDISDWATGQLQNKGIKIAQEGCFDTIICLDVLEHMTNKQIKAMFHRFWSRFLIVRIPVSTNGQHFHLQVSRNDPTHINCKTKHDWLALLKANGFQECFRLHSNHIYDSQGVLCSLLERKS